MQKMTIIPFRWQRVESGMNDRSSFCEYVEAGYCTLPNWLQAWLDMSQNTVFCMILCLMSGKHVDLGWGSRFQVDPFFEVSTLTKPIVNFP